MKKEKIAGKQRARVIGRMLLLSLSLASARAADPGVEPDSAATVDAEAFQAAGPLRGPNSLAYPDRERREGREGWVLLEMMIDPQGKPHEIGVLESSGNPALEQAAVRAVDEMKFAPAKRSGTPVDSHLIFKMVFYSSGHPAQGASAKFATAYKGFQTAMEAQSKEKADTAFENMDAENLYEDAIKSYCKFLYDRTWGTEVDQLEDLKRAVAGEKIPKYVPKDLFTRILMAQFVLQVKLLDYGTALNTWKTLQPIAPSPVHDALQHTVDQIIAVRDGNQAVRTSAHIGNIAAWNGHLFKNHFAISVSSGAVSDIKLRCKKQYLTFSFKPELEYAVNPSAGECWIEVDGDPGTSFYLVQS